MEEEPDGSEKALEQNTKTSENNCMVEEAGGNYSVGNLLQWFSLFLINKDPGVEDKESQKEEAINQKTNIVNDDLQSGACN